MEKKIFEIISLIMEIPVETITKESNSETIENWESLKHMNLILALEEEFDVMFTDAEIVNLTNVGSIIDSITQKESL